MINSIKLVTETKERLEVVFKKKHPQAPASKFEIGIDPETGKYLIIIFLNNMQYSRFIPSSLAGFRIMIDGIN